MMGLCRWFTVAVALSIITAIYGKQQTITCEEYVRRVDQLVDRSQLSYTPEKTKVYCVDWLSNETPTWHWLLITEGNNTIQEAIGVWGKVYPCRGRWINYFQMVRPDGKVMPKYTRCQLNTWQVYCNRQYGPGNWAVQPADNQLNDWSPFMIQGFNATSRFAPGGVTFHRNAHFMSRSRAFAREFTYDQLNESMC